MNHRLWSDLNAQRGWSLDDLINEPLWHSGGRGQGLHQRGLCAPSSSEDSSCFQQARELKINKYENARLPSHFFSYLVPARASAGRAAPRKTAAAVPGRPSHATRAATALSACLSLFAPLSISKNHQLPSLYNHQVNKGPAKPSSRPRLHPVRGCHGRAARGTRTP